MSEHGFLEIRHFDGELRDLDGLNEKIGEILENCGIFSSSFDSEDFEGFLRMGSDGQIELWQGENIVSEEKYRANSVQYYGGGSDFAKAFARHLVSGEIRFTVDEGDGDITYYRVEPWKVSEKSDPWKDWSLIEA